MHVCVLEGAPAWMCVCVFPCSSDKTYMQSLYAAQTLHFPNELLPWWWQPCAGWLHGNRLLTSYLGPTPNQGVGVVVCVTVIVCVLAKICKRRVESTSLLFAASLSLQWWRVTELWYLNLPRDSGSALIFSVALLSELSRFTSELI